MIIGKIYSSKDLAFYSKGQTYPKLITNNLRSAITSVTFPMFSKIQDDKGATSAALSRTISLTSYIILPAMIGFAMVAEPFVKVLLTEKWLPSIPYLQVVCLIYAVSAIQTPKLQCLNAHGYSDVYLKTSIFKKIYGVLILLCVFKISVFWIVLSGLIAALLDALVDSLMLQKYIGYSMVKQAKDVLLNLMSSLVMAACLFISEKLLSDINCLVALIIQVIIGIIVYVVISVVSHNNSFNYILDILKKIKKRGNKNG